LRSRAGQIHPDLLRWGFRADAGKPFAPINAKSETLFEKWPWKYAAVHRRCLVPMDGFYEPKGPSSQRQRSQFLFRFGDRRPFFVAGVWTRQVVGDLDSFALVTTAPNEQVAPIHERMPAVVAPEAQELWLSDTKDVAALRSVLGPWTADRLDCWEVDRQRLNGADDERCVLPI
jgi:putative SOS response-associated peptidase YedK